MHTYKTIILFSVSLIMVRFMGKRAIAQLSPFDLITIIIMGSAVAIPLENDKIKLTYGIVPVAIISILNYIIAVLITKSRKLENLLQGHSTVLIRDGEVLMRNLKKERITVADLLVLLREKDVCNINEIEEATIEPNGKISIIKKKAMQTVTCKDLGLENSQGIFPTLVVDKGEVLFGNLKKIEVGIEMLLSELNKKGIEQLNHINSAWIDEHGNLSVKRKSEERAYNMENGNKGIFKKLGIDRKKLAEEFGIDLYFFLDAVSLGLSDEEISDIMGQNPEKIRNLRKRLNNIGSEIGLNTKKDLP